jgi:2-oxoisovalerate dehydrogenase E1 component
MSALPLPQTRPTAAPFPTMELPRSGELADVLQAMLAIRRFEERVLQLRRQNDISGSVHLCVGQEIVPVAVLAALDHRDRVLATYRGHGWALASGVPFDALLGEIMGRAGGTNGGRGGSAYLSSPDHGFVGETSIVGAGLPVANGVAMGLLAKGERGIAVVSFGDGATNQGASHEALVFAIARKLPVLFVCENNSWSEMTPISMTVPKARLFERAAGYGMSARQVDGADAEAVLFAAREAISSVRAGEGPYFLEVTVPRLLGHYNADVEHYRSAEDREEHARRDPIVALSARLLVEGSLSDGQVQAMEAAAIRLVDEAELRAWEMPMPSTNTAALHVTGTGPGTSGDSLIAQEGGVELKYGMAVNLALSMELAEREEVVVFGEDIAIAGGTFGVTRNLRKQFGDRVFDTPISEAAILGAAIGASIEGLRPIVEIMWSDFVFVAFDQIINQASNVRYIARGKQSAPLVIRMQQGITPGSCAQHSQSIEAILAHIPGIKVGMPATPQDAFAMLRAAIADPDPVVIIESRELYLTSGRVDVEASVESVGGARLRRRGEHLLIVTWGRMTHAALEAAELLSFEGIETSVLDLRWINPLDEPAIAKVLAESGGRVLIVHEANVSGGFGAEVAARIAERHSSLLKAPLRRIGLPDSASRPSAWTRRHCA